MTWGRPVPRHLYWDLGHYTRPWEDREGMLTTLEEVEGEGEYDWFSYPPKETWHPGRVSHRGIGRVVVMWGPKNKPGGRKNPHRSDLTRRAEARGEFAHRRLKEENDGI
jgi:hypothetical protein